MTTILILAAVALLLVAVVPSVRRTIDRRSGRWLDAFLKSVVIFVSVALFTVFVPSYVVQHEEVAKLDRDVQDLIGAGVWGAGFVGSLLLLSYAHRRQRI
jgi:lipid-A-disaccharide synthase-like uncharacterized protein